MNTEPTLMKEGCCDIHSGGVCGVKCFSWSAIVAGALIAIGLSFLINLFSTAIGLSIFTVDSADGMKKLAVGGMLAFAIGIIVIMFFSGWVAGFIGSSKCDKKYCGGIYGLLAWCLSLIIMITLAGPATIFVKNSNDYLGHIVTSDLHSSAIAVGSTDQGVQAKANEEAAADLSKGAFVLFFMFFVGALAATAGGHCGVHCARKECCDHKHPVR